MKTDYQIHYEHSELDEWWCKLTLGNVSVAVGEAPGAGDQSEWEIIDASNGQQLSFRRIADDHTASDVWPDLMQKAHHHLLELHRKAREQAARDAEARRLHLRLQDELTAISHLIETGGYTGLTVEQLSKLTRATDLVIEAQEEIDEAYDPDPDELLLTTPAG